MTDHDALLAAVLAAPADDLPRLVYADWLDEHGDPDRAAFIRTQVRLASADPWEPAAVRVRAFDPDAVTGRPWVHTLPRPPFAAEWLPDRPFHRGFGWAVRLTALTGLLDSGGRLFDEAPVGELHLPTATLDEWRRVGRSAWLPRVRAVRFFGTRMPVEPVRVFCDSPLATGIDSIRFDRSSGLALSELVEGIFQSPLGSQLRDLEFRAGDQHVGHILEGFFQVGAKPPRLARLAFVTMGLAFEEIYRLGHAPILIPLTELVIENNALSGMLAWLLSSLHRLHSLRLVRAELEPDDMNRIAFTPQLARLRRLDLARNPLGPEGVRELASSDTLTALRSLGLRQAFANDAGVRFLTASMFWPNLVELDLGENRLTDAGAAALLRAEVPPDLAAVRLDGNAFSPGVRAGLDRHFAGRAVFDAPP